LSGDAVDVVARLKEESEVPLRSHGSLSLNRALMGAGLVDRLQVTLFPVITGQTGLDPIFQGAADFDLELIENRTLDGHIQELTYRPTLHGPVRIRRGSGLSPPGRSRSLRVLRPTLCAARLDINMAHAGRSFDGPGRDAGAAPAPEATP
jgi:hypothetical protein